MAENLTETLTKLIALLEPLEEEERQRIIHSTMVFFGSTLAPTKSGVPEGEQNESSEASLPIKATQWLKRNDISQQSLENIFEITDDEVEVIADLPESSNKTRTQQCYLLSGLKNLLQSGEPKINDEQARGLCRHNGCYDNANHSAYVKSLKSSVSGTKETGLTLTTPGLRAAAELVKQLATPKQ